MVDLPTGTVTYLFTDVVGSTRLWEQHPDAMRAALVRHDGIIEAAVAQHDGVVVRPRGEGDSRFAVFARATNAVAAAAAIQVALHDEAWPAETPLRVRMALHTGEADRRDGDYYGSAVNRCARLRAIAHGGQGLLSQATHDFVRDRLPVPIGLRDLGDHRLSDLSGAEHVYQLLHPRLPADFPPLPSGDRQRSTLPLPLTGFIGREREATELIARLGSGQTRLLTLCGPGGVGKTRLALHVATVLAPRYADGVAFAALAGVTRAGQAAATVVHALRLQPGPERSAEQTLHDYLRSRQMLLVLDNLEQVPDAAAMAIGLLEQAPALVLLATSRAVLRAYGEWEYPVPPLALPDARATPSLEILMASEAIRLFVERAQAVRPGIALTADNAAVLLAICRRLDGLPLALELAAARLRLLTPRELLARLERRLPLLTGGARTLPERQQTLRATIAWSYALLQPDEQALFRRLAVFSGGCTVAAAEAVMAAGPLALELLDGLETLASQSLLRQEERAGGSRVVLLETIREFGLEQLTLAGEAVATHQAHFDQVLALFEQLGPAVHGPDQSVTLAQLDEEGLNLQQAIDWGVGQGDATPLLRLVVAAYFHWFHRTRFLEGIEGLARAVALPGGASGPRSLALAFLGHLLWARGDRLAGRRRVEEGYALADAAGDRHALAVAVFYRGFTSDAPSAARGCYDEAVTRTRELGRTWELATALLFASATAFRLGDNAAGARQLEEGGRLFRALGNPWGIAASTAMVAQLAMAKGDIPAAARNYTEYLRLNRALDDPWGVALAQLALGRAAVRAADWPEARTHFEAAVATHRELGIRAGLIEAQAELAVVALAQGQPDEAAERLGEALSLGRAIGDRQVLAPALAGWAALAVAEGRFEKALQLHGAAKALRGQGGVGGETAGIEHVAPWIGQARVALGAAAAALEGAGGLLTPEQATAAALERTS